MNLTQANSSGSPDLSSIATNILRNSGFVFLTQTIAMVSHVLIYSWMGKTWGPTRFGHIAFLLTFAQLFTFIASLGINHILTREMARDSRTFHTYWRNAIGMWGVQAFIMCVIVVSVGRLFVKGDALWPLCLAGIYVAFNAYRSLFVSLFHSTQRMEFETGVILVEQAAALVSVYIILGVGGGVSEVLLALVASRLLGILVYWVLVPIFLKKMPIPALDWDVWTKLARMSVPFALNLLLTPIYAKSDVVLISLFLGDRATGLYRAALVLIAPLAMIATSLNFALYPVVSKTFEEERKVRQFAQKSVQLLLCISVPITAGTVVLARRFIGVLYTQEFASSVIILQGLALLIPFRFTSNALATILTSTNQQKLRTLAIGIGTGIGTALNLVLIPVWGYLAAVVIAVVKDIIITAMLSIYTRRYFRISNCLQYLPKLLLANGVLALFLIMLRDLNLLLLVFASLILYSGLLIVIRFWADSDLALLRRVILGRSKHASRFLS
jgi:O-antigen/teichoic acid export membrane protein